VQVRLEKQRSTSDPTPEMHEQHLIRHCEPVKETDDSTRRGRIDYAIHSQRASISRAPLRGALSDLGTNAEPALTLLVERLNDSSESTDVQRSCATALGKIGKEPERVVPALAASLSNTEVRVPAMKALYLFGTNATGAIPALLPLLQDPNTNLAGATRRVLGTIDPEKWKPSPENGGTP